MIKERLKKRKLLIALVIIMVVSFICGVLFVSVLSDSNQELIKSSINSYFNGINNNEMNYLRSLYSVLTSNLLLVIFLWVIGISIVGIILIVLALIFKSFLVGFSFTSIIYTYGFKGLLTGIIYSIPEMIGLFVVFVISYYAINFSFVLFNMLFRKKEYNKKVIVSRYLKLLLIACVVMVLISLLSVFVIPNILRFF